MLLASIGTYRYSEYTHDLRLEVFVHCPLLSEVLLAVPTAPYHHLFL